MKLFTFMIFMVIGFTACRKGQAVNPILDPLFTTKEGWELDSVVNLQTDSVSYPESDTQRSFYYANRDMLFYFHPDSTFAMGNYYLPIFGKFELRDTNIRIVARELADNILAKPYSPFHTVAMEALNSAVSYKIIDQPELDSNKIQMYLYYNDRKWVARFSSLVIK